MVRIHDIVVSLVHYVDLEAFEETFTLGIRSCSRAESLHFRNHMCVDFSPRSFCFPDDKIAGRAVFDIDEILDLRVAFCYLRDKSLYIVGKISESLALFKSDGIATRATICKLAVDSDWANFMDIKSPPARSRLVRLHYI